MFWKNVFLKKSAVQMFYCKFDKIFKNTFFGNMWTSASELLIK